VNQTYRISGTPTESGVFSFTILATGNCVSATTNATITVKPNATVSLTSGTATNTICINKAIVTPIVYNTTFANSVSLIGNLPPGVLATIDNTTKQLTISGTATQFGTFTYTVVALGDCASATATGTITVKPDVAITLNSGTTTQTICINTLLTNIVYDISNETGLISLSTQFPAGVTGTYSATTHQFIISGTPTQSGTFTYTITAIGACATATASGTITVKPDATITIVGGTATNTICINNPLPTIVKYRSTSSATDIRIIAGRLPGGLVPSYNPLTQEYTITGIATESGTFTYTIATFGGCVTSSTTGTITVKPDTQIALTSSPTTNAQAICINTLLTNITYATQNANTVTIPSLPPGINYTFSATTQLVTISGVPTQSGTFTYTIIAYGDCISATTTGTITVKPDATITLVGGTATNTICINNPLPTIVKYRSTSSTTDIHIIAGRLPGGLVPNYNPLTQEYTISGVATESGTFTYTIATFGDCVTATTTGTITVKPDTQIGITSGVNSNNPSLCINTLLTNITYGTQNANTVNITGLPGGLTYTFSATTQAVVISGTPTQSGTFTYTIVAYGDCLSKTTTGTITVNENFINLRRPITETCINTTLQTIVYDILYADAATLTGNLPFGVSWTYSSTTRQLSISGIPTNSGTFTYTITTIGGCATKTVTASMTVNPDNTITLTSVPSTTTQVVGINTPIVDIVYLTTGATNVRALNLPRNIQQSYNAQTHVFRIYGSSNEAGTLTYTVMLDGGCGVISTTGSLDIKPNNTITLSSTTGAEACINIANVNVVYKTTLATGATITNTLPTGLTGQWLVRGADSLYVISGIPTQAGTFNYTITLTGGYGNITKQGTLLIDPTTVAGTIASSASIICNNTTPPTISVSGNVGNTFKWQSSTDGITYTDMSPAQINSSISSAVNNAAPGSTQVTTYYKVIVQSGVCPSQITNPVTIKVDPTSKVGDIAAIQKIQEWCINSPAMAVTIPSNVGNIIWQTASSLTGPFTTINGQTGNTLPSNRIPTTAPGVLYYKAVVTSGVCPAINSDIVKVTTDAATVPGNVYFLKGSSPICNNGDKPTVSITNNVGDNIVWQVSGSSSTSVPISTLSYANTTQTGNLLNSAIDNTAPGVNSNFKYYRAAVKNGVCNVEYTQPIELEVIPTPVVTSAISNERCGPGTVKLLGVSNLGEVNWFESTTGGTAIGVGGIFVTPVISETTNYYAGALYRGCASASRLLAVAKVKEVPTITTVTSASNCGPAILSLSAVQSSGVINWFADEIGGNSINATQNYTTPLLKKTTTYYVEATLNGCTTVNRTPVIATIFEVPVVKPLAEPVSLCIGKKISLVNNASLGLPPYSYTIYLDNDNLIGQTDGTIIGVKDGATNVYFNVKDKNGCVSLNSNTFKITTFQPIPSQSFNYQAYYLDNFVIPTKKDTGYVLYNWQPPMYLNSYTKADPVFNSAFTTDYILVRTDTTTKCTVADSYHIDVTKDFIFDLPNAFTPNGDGLNDVIKPEANAGIESLHLMIFNRSGKLIFETKDKNEGWDGKYGQVLQDADVYYWIVDYVTKAGQQRKKSGSFLLLK
jgi:gliding motility-associated-like protein